MFDTREEADAYMPPGNRVLLGSKVVMRVTFHPENFTRDGTCQRLFSYDLTVGKGGVQ